MPVCANVLWTHMKANIEGNAIELESDKNVLITHCYIDTSHTVCHIEG